nr:hypothetical protein [Acidobacteriota bacterium]
MLRKARREDLPEIERVMRASMADLGARFYDADQVASAVQYIAVADGQLVDDGTYFVVEESSSEFLGVPRSSSEELAGGSAPPR